MLFKILKLSPLDVTPELAAIRDSLIVERLKDDIRKLVQYVEESPR